MASPEHDDLEGELAALIAAADHPPPQVVEAAEAAWAWRTIDAELARLSFDSADPELTTASRGTSSHRLTFAFGENELDLEAADDQLVVISDLDSHHVRCETPDGVVWNAVIVEGECSGSLPSKRPIRLVIADSIGRLVIKTPWFLP